MSLQAFSFPLPETRLFKAGSLVYKFKIRGGSSYSGVEEMGENCINQELEDIIRTVIANLDSLQPFSSAHFNVFPYKKQWKEGSNLIFKHDTEKLAAYPHTVTLYLESNTQTGKKTDENLTPNKNRSPCFPSNYEPLPKRSRSDSPLEEAIIKELIMDAEIEAHRTEMYVDSSHLEDAGRDGQSLHLLPQKGTELVESQWEAGINSQLTTALGEVHTGTAEDGEEEEEDEDEEEVNVDPSPQPPVRRGVMKLLASHIFPFSLFFKES
ncbi:membrane-anchored junction protein isoform X2 [Myripristis murdjan]|uniref:membrane-anchored junction protein isoform X2 n=1 Tax=Myripristis murdjan TaxID=586833 RepID=UPI001176403F|nr:membrane-anchored junction protein isoform X2 [Myripristis murdjan]